VSAAYVLDAIRTPFGRYGGGLSTVRPPALASVPNHRRSTLLAQPVDGGYQIDIHLQGESETVFFAV